MSVYLDDVGHLAADSVDELHRFAARIGLGISWFQAKGPLSHYDVTTKRKRAVAVRMGAKRVGSREMPGIVRRMNT